MKRLDPRIALRSAPAWLSALAVIWVGVEAPFWLDPPSLKRALPGLALAAPHFLGEPGRLSAVVYLLELLALPALFLAAETAFARLARRFDRHSGFVWAFAAAGLLAQAAIVCGVFVAWSTQSSFIRRLSDSLLSWKVILGVVVFGALGAFAALSAAIKKTTKAPWIAAALAIAALGIVSAVFTDANVGCAHWGVRTHIHGMMGEFTGVLNGKTDLVDFNQEYQHLVPYLFLPLFKVAGISIGSLTFVLAMLSLAGLAFVYLIFEKVFADRILGFVAYAGVLFVSLFPLPQATPNSSYNGFNYYQTMPFRYAAPLALGYLLLAWLRKPSRFLLRVLGFASGCVALNNLDLGAPALAGCFLAVLARSHRHPSGTTGAWRKLAEFAASAAAAWAGFVAWTWLRSGHLPDFSMLLTFHRELVGQGTDNGQPLSSPPAFGFYVLLLGTFLAAFVTGLKRRQGDGAILIYFGVLGCAALGLYVAEALPGTLVAAFPAWGICLALLLNIALSEKTSLENIAAVLLSIAGMGFMLSTVAFFPPPWRELGRFGLFGGSCSQPFVTLFTDPLAALLKKDASARDRVFIVSPFADLAAIQNGVSNVFPFPTHWALTDARITRKATDALIASGVTQAIVTQAAFGEKQNLEAELRSLGFEPVDRVDRDYMGYPFGAVFWRRGAVTAPRVSD